MGVELNMPYEKKAIGQLLEELGKKEKWRSCLITIQTPLPSRYRQNESASFHSLKIVDLRKTGGRYELVLMPAKNGFLPIPVKYFFWPGDKDEQGKDGLKKPILSITVLEVAGFWPKVKDSIRSIFRR